MFTQQEADDPLARPDPATPDPREGPRHQDNDRDEAGLSPPCEDTLCVVTESVHLYVTAQRLLAAGLDALAVPPKEARTIMTLLSNHDLRDQEGLELDLAAVLRRLRDLPERPPLHEVTSRLPAPTLRQLSDLSRKIADLSRRLGRHS